MIDYSFIDSAEFAAFYKDNENVDSATLRLKRFKGLSFDKEAAIRQIVCRKKTVKKLPYLYDKLAYPTDVSIEQCSSEELAKFHSELFKDCSLVADLTCGLGIDAFYISQEARKVMAVELNEEAVNAAQFNYKRLGATNISVFAHDSETFLKESTQRFSACFIDPSRRVKEDTHHRVYRIEDCSPSVTSVLQQLQGRCNFLIVKASPMVDITQTIRDYPGISDIWILSLRNECKELLFKINLKESTSSTEIHAIDINGKLRTEFSYPYEPTKGLENITPLKPEKGYFALIPNVAIMKSGAFDTLCNRFKLFKTADFCHLFLSQQDFTKPFPGRKFIIKDIFSFSKKDIHLLRETYPTANLMSYNPKLSTANVQAKLKINDGGDFYIFAILSSIDGKGYLLACQKA